MHSTAYSLRRNAKERVKNHVSIYASRIDPTRASSKPVVSQKRHDGLRHSCYRLARPVHLMDPPS